MSKLSEKIDKDMATDQDQLRKLGESLVGRLVWAKLPGWPWWPSKVNYTA